MACKIYGYECWTAGEAHKTMYENQEFRVLSNPKKVAKIVILELGQFE